MGREIAFCREKIRKVKDALERFEKQCGMTTEASLQALEEENLSAHLPIQSWKQEYQELHYWLKMLTEYEAALESLKRL